MVLSGEVEMIDSIHPKEHPTGTLENKIRKVKIGFQGVPGAYSHQAIEHLLLSDDLDCQIESIGFESFESTHFALKSGKADFILVMV